MEIPKPMYPDIYTSGCEPGATEAGPMGKHLTFRPAALKTPEYRISVYESTSETVPFISHFVNPVRPSRVRC